MGTQKVIVLFGCCLLFNLVKAQSIERYVIGSAGASTSTASIQMDYTLGESVIGTFGSGSTTLTQGFHQNELIGIGVDEMGLNTTFIIYPNPTLTLLYVEHKDVFENERYQFGVLDLKGSMVKGVQDPLETLGSRVNVIDVSDLPSSSYVLRMLDSKTGRVQHFIFEKVE